MILKSRYWVETEARFLDDGAEILTNGSSHWDRFRFDIGEVAAFHPTTEGNTTIVFKSGDTWTINMKYEEVADSINQYSNSFKHN